MDFIAMGGLQDKPTSNIQAEPYTELASMLRYQTCVETTPIGTCRLHVTCDQAVRVSFAS